MSVSEPAQHQSPETSSPKWNEAVIIVTNSTCAVKRVCYVKTCVFNSFQRLDSCCFFKLFVVWNLGELFHSELTFIQVFLAVPALFLKILASY